MSRDVECLVTVVTVTYNSSLFVRDAIESILAQHYTNFEYIIGDDCSTDDTWDIICEYHDPRIRKYRNEKNIREYPNRNKAIEMATGKYLIFIDGDDILLTHGLGYYVEMMEKFPEAGMAIQKGYYNHIVFPALLQSEEIIRNHYFGHEDMLSSSFASNFFKTTILKKEGLLSTDHKGGDNEVRVRIALRYPILFIAGWVSWPRETPGSASSKISLSRSNLEMLMYTKNLIKENCGLRPEIIKDIDGVLKRRTVRHILSFLKSARFASAFKLKHSTGIGFVDIWKYWNYTPHSKDFMLDFTPVLPYKKDYLR